MNAILTERAKSGFPVSIGTSLALETLLEPTMEVYDESRVVPERVKTSDYDVILINVATLLRNILGSITSDDATSVKPADYLETLREEIQYLNDLFVFQDLEPAFYIHTYDYVKKDYPPEKLRKGTTLKQLSVEMVNTYCLTELQKDKSIRRYTNKVHLDKSLKAVIMTHVPWDLLSHTEFLKLDLLESHTGLLKTRKDWWSKYYKMPNRDMSMLPFTQELLGIFGDNIMFHPDPMKKRVEVYERLSTKRVNAMSGDDAVKMLLGTFI